ncbi:MAG: low molecular weight protein-tyrosine phosphatase [Nocardioidaceae bacterium]|nr:low molecular weight protein-tyrosine phosphatase [Nocardioidaceae bacterium]
MTSPAADEGSPPRPTHGAFAILAVCTGNICRSPMVEHLLRDALASAPGSTPFEVGSAGVRGWDGAPMDPPAAAELRRLGGDPSGFRGRSFSAVLGERADLILTATADHRRLVLQEVPQALHRTFTLLEFAHLVSAVDGVTEAAGDPPELVSRASAHRGAARIDAYDLGDPYGQPAAVHRRTAELARAAVGEISGALTARG